LTFNADHLDGAAPYVRSLVQGIDAQSALPMLLSAYIKFKPSELADIVKLLLVFVTRWSILVGFDSAELESKLFEMARSIREIPEGDEKAKRSKFREIKETLKKLSPTDQQIDTSIARLVLPTDGAEYVMRKISDAMESKTKEKSTGRESNLEHIYPQNPEDGSWGGDANQALLEPYTWHIGNLTMLGERLNTRAKNAEYVDKRQKYATSELQMAKSIAKNYTKWDRASIEHRAKGLASLLKQIWNLDNPSLV
jgi:hypothetical protein